MARLSARVWENRMLTTNTKMQVYQACVLRTLLYGSEAWTLYSHQECRLNTFHLRSLRKILGIKWQDQIPNSSVLELAGIQSMYAILSQRRLRWLGHVRRMDDGRIPKDILYGELATGSRRTGRPILRYKDTCKRDMKSGCIDPTNWEALAADRSKWRAAVRTAVSHREEQRGEQWEEKRKRRHHRGIPLLDNSTSFSGFTCSSCNRACGSRIGLFSHSKRKVWKNGLNSKRVGLP
ncbi:hypothetical protein BSL78_25071 [Apostichopus japonicus]|uniref:Endonuclease-reverse transcriptase n=1 Tax=Stichopus japonicus TaxID=307972 RepID=A0A2G8JQR5_STIJA|nr:hypothetical protein BSL78_25071 [Apostichopus japonicus]